MEYKNILLAFEGEIGIFMINRPKSLNALNIETLKDIQMGIQEVKEHPEVKVLILTGAGEKAFVAGAHSDRENDQCRGGLSDGDC